MMAGSNGAMDVDDAVIIVEDEPAAKRRCPEPSGAESAEVACPRCTFLNPAAHLQCSLCGSVIASTSASEARPPAARPAPAAAAPAAAAPASGKRRLLMGEIVVFGYSTRSGKSSSYVSQGERWVRILQEHRSESRRKAKENRKQHNNKEGGHRKRRQHIYVISFFLMLYFENIINILFSSSSSSSSFSFFFPFFCFSFIFLFFFFFFFSFEE